MTQRTQDRFKAFLLIGTTLAIFTALLLDRWYATVPLIILLSWLTYRWLPPRPGSNADPPLLSFLRLFRNTKKGDGDGTA